ncbi:MAG: response regulator [Chitinophagia bacterium]|nr:response regulator [Chitinophagia bacterium]
MFKVVLIDDEPLARQLIGAYLKPYSNIEIAGEAGDGFEGFKMIQQLQPDLLFLDVQMPRVSGFEMLELLEQPPSVIFTTAFDEYAIKAFEAQAVDYLLKPVTRERFDKAMQKWLQRAPEQRPQQVSIPEAQLEGYQGRIVVKDNQVIRIIPVSEIQYIEACDDYVKIFTATGTYLKKSTLTHIENGLDPAQFVRVHRSYIIPVTQLSRIEPYEKDSHIALLHSGAKVLVSKSGMARLKETLGW